MLEYTIGIMRDGGRPRRYIRIKSDEAIQVLEGVIMEQDVISRIESGSRLVTDYELLALTKIFAVSADWLIGSG